MRELTYYVAVTIDGFISGPDGEIDAFPVEGSHIDALAAEYPETFPGPLRRMLGIEGPARHFDTVIMGRATYEPALAAGLSSPYPHLEQYVCSRTLHVDDPSVTVVQDDPLALVRSLKQRAGLGIWLCGGGVLASSLLPEIDSLTLKVNPVVIGRGRSLFGDADVRGDFELAGVEIFESGVGVVRYRRRSD